jgi:hypothetical protein
MDGAPTKTEEMIETPGLDHVLSQLVPQAADALNRSRSYQTVLLVGPTGSGKSFNRDKIMKMAGYSDENYVTVKLC